MFFKRKHTCIRKNNKRIIKISTATRVISTLLNLSGVEEITTDPQSGAVFVTTTDKHEVHKFTKNGDLLKTVGGIGSQPGQFKFPNGLRVSRQSELYVCDSLNDRIQIFDLDLNFKRVLETDSSLPMEAWPSDVDFDSSGNIYIVCLKRNCILVLSPAGKLLFVTQIVCENPLFYPVSLVFYRELMYITELGGHRVSVITPSGELVARFGEGYLEKPEGIAIDEDGYVYVTSDKSKILMF